MYKGVYVKSRVRIFRSRPSFRMRTNYLAVVVVQAVALADQTTEVDIQSRRLAASVLLVKALGGGWSVTDLLSS